MRSVLDPYAQRTDADEARAVGSRQSGVPLVTNERHTGETGGDSGDSASPRPVLGGCQGEQVGNTDHRSAAIAYRAGCNTLIVIRHHDGDGQVVDQRATEAPAPPVRRRPSPELVGCPHKAPAHGNPGWMLRWLAVDPFSIEEQPEALRRQVYRGEAVLDGASSRAVHHPANHIPGRWTIAECDGVRVQRRRPSLRDPHLRVEWVVNTVRSTHQITPLGVVSCGRDSTRIHWRSMTCPLSPRPHGRSRRTGNASWPSCAAAARLRTWSRGT